ncbi:efflux RND transporter periplasmic adaptor subunit [Sphingomonas sp.]|uniref:efflux RND transporter periplasmic adaptor subunit n=1 Tax=Sphingomonas sp. TaxID=28214 RepID=UPI0025F6076A|nr:efflux RND transporter periplasmic adaptor subunit [Sphingomonas sp.]
MKLDRTMRARLGAAAAAIALIGGAAGYYLGSSGGGGGEVPTASSTTDGKEVLYYYDPMFPNQKFDKPGKSPFMDMELVPKYAGEGGGGEPGVTIDPSAMQNLGLRTAVARIGTLESRVDAVGTIDFNQREVAIVQPRASGFVQRTYHRAPGDVIPAGAPIVDLLIPEWGGAQAEYLAVRKLGNPAYTAAARQRLRLLGMSDGLISSVERSGRPNNIVTITAPLGGAIQSIDVRPGMTVSAGQSLAQVTGLGTVWLNAAVPEARASEIRLGQSASAELTAFPGDRFSGRIIGILPTTNADSRTLTVRIELRNSGGRLRPGMFANVRLGEVAQTAILVPTEAVIRTGQRTLVMLAEDKGRYRPAEVRAGRESGGQTEILAGLRDGERVVASGQFLLDSEATLTGIPARPIDEAASK